MGQDPDITQSFEPPATAPPPPEPPPARLLEDVWPWLGLLGVLAVAGLLVWLFVFRDNGHKGRTVPAVVGLQQQVAVQRLTSKGFSVRAVIGPAAKPQGVVISQAPGGGSRLDRGQTVVLHVSNGHPVQVVTSTVGTTTTTARTTTAPVPQVSVPDVSGEDMVSAAGQVEAAGLVAETTPVTGGGTAGSVVDESPAAGSQAPAGSAVVLSVATGSSRPQVQVPNVVGQKSAAARATLLRAKLTAKTVYKHGPAKNVGIVLSQAPTGAVPAYTQITITVGS